MINRILSIRNRLDYYLRQSIRWSRSGLALTEDSKINAFGRLKPEQKKTAREIERRLSQSYDLEDLSRRGDVDNYRTNLYYLEFLEKALDRIGIDIPKKVIVADVGCSSWFYVRALWACLKSWKTNPICREVELHGYEIDAYRPYLNLYSRLDYAKVFSKNLHSVHYHPTAFESSPESFHIMCQFFPFIFKKDHLAWGLPETHFSPLSLLENIWKSLKPNGILLITNQGIKEHEVQKEMFENLGIKTETAFRVESVFNRYEIEHYILGAVKNG